MDKDSYGMTVLIQLVATVMLEASRPFTQLVKTKKHSLLSDAFYVNYYKLYEFTS
jgi:hypothetical protein